MLGAKGRNLKGGARSQGGHNKPMVMRQCPQRGDGVGVQSQEAKEEKGSVE